MTIGRPISSPSIGYWAVRLAKNGAEVGARIYWLRCGDCGAALDPTTIANITEGRPELAAEIDGEPASVDDVWLRRGRVIDETEYRWLLEDARWCREHAPEEPRAQPRQAVDIRQLRPMV